MKKVSVILTTYNSAKTIQNVLDHILNQQGAGKDFELELIVVDDCSTDNTADILKKNDLQFFSTPSNSGGPNKGRNIGLGKVSGDFICIADHDDVWKKDKLISMLPYLEKAPVISSGYTVVDSKANKKLDRVKTGQSHLEFKKNLTFKHKLTRSWDGQNTYLGSLMYRSELKDILFEEDFGVVDFDWVLRLFYKRNSIEVGKSLYTRYVDGSNLSLDEGYRKKDYAYTMKTLDGYAQEFPAEVERARKRSHGSMAR